MAGSFLDALESFGEPDLVHDNGLWLPCHHKVMRECARRKIPTVVSPRGMLEPWALRQRHWKKKLAWHLYQKCDLRSARLLHATSSAELEQFRRLGLNQPAVVLPNGVSLPEELRISEVGSRKSQVRTALFLSRLHPKKGLEMLVKAWAQVRPAGWTMRVVGPDEIGYRQKIKDAVVREGLIDDWVFEEMSEGIAKWRGLTEADLFILPSFSENFGIVVAEALVAGVPVITTTATPWQGLLEHRCGWWVEPTVNGITAALRQATSLPSAELTGMGQRGSVWARNDFAWPPIAQTMVEAYRWTVNGDKKPDCIV
jgi:glycosyltransferase involved in cell wall biosynthesis